MWVATQDLPRSAAHPVYRRLNRVLDDAQFDAFVEGACATFYGLGAAARVGRRKLDQGRLHDLAVVLTQRGGEQNVGDADQRQRARQEQQPVPPCQIQREPVAKAFTPP